MGVNGMNWQRHLVAIVALMSAASAGAANLDFLPSRAELMRPAPNKAWDQFSSAPDAHGVYPIAEGVYLFMYRGTNSLFMVTDEGVIATDPIRAHAAPVYLEAIRSVTDQPVKHLIYSHWHWDHVEGGQAFRDLGAKILSHEACIPHLTDRPNPDVAMPDETFSGSHTVSLGNRSLELIYLGTNHSDCLVFMRPDGVNALFVVDLITPGSVGGNVFMDYVPHHWVRTLKAIEAMKLDYIISGHGVPLAHASAITERRQYLEALMGAVGTAYQQRLNSTERTALIEAKLKPFASKRVRRPCRKGHHWGRQNECRWQHS
jgi:glyoxylase-like metal-dependent hydrolase (beta-lactamase superfamily II)